MSTRLVSALSILVLATGLTLLAACNQLKMPRITYPTEQGPVIPLSVKLVFDESVRSATLEQTVCADVLWKGRLGDAIIQSFSETGRARLTQLTVGDQPGTAQPATVPASEFTAFITLTSASFTPTSRSGSDDNSYLAQFDVRLKATFQDTQVRRFPDAPMVYSDRVALWTPQMSGSGGSDYQCATGQLDAAMHKAGDHLASQLMAYLMQLREKTQGETTAARQSPVAGPSLLALKTTLLDENNNLLLEGGEKVGVRIDVTNTGKTPLGPVTVTLSGTPALIDAFAGALSSPAQIPALQPGETKSTVLWGTVPANAEGSRGELTVTVTPAGSRASAPAIQTLVAAIQPRHAQAAAPMATDQPAPDSRRSLRETDRYAVIVELSLYRSPWPGWRDGLRVDNKETVSLFAHALGVPEGNTLLLQDELAARTDIEEALASWLPKRVTKDSIVFFYFAGQTVANPKNREIFLIPYDATPASSPFRLISLRFLQSRLQKLGARLAVAVIEAPVAQAAAAKNGKSRSAAPNWTGDLDGSSNVGTGTVIQISRLNYSSQVRQSLLNGLTGKADLDQDGTVTVGEWLRSLKSLAVTAPTLPPDLSIQSIPLSRVNRP